MPVTITASGNSTPPAGTQIATQTVASQDYQQFILADNSGSALGQVAASPFYVSAALTAGAAIIGTACAVMSGAWGVSASVVNSPSVVVVSAVASPLFASISNLAGSAAGSPLFVSVANSTGSTLVTNLTGSAAGSPIFSSITNLAGSAAGSPLFVTQNNMTGSAAGSPMFSSITNLAGSAAGSPLFVSACLTNMAGSAAGSPLFTSTVITNLAGSAAGSPLFSSITNVASVIVSSGSLIVTNALSASISGGSVANLAGTNVIGSASVIQSTPTGIANAWPVRLVDSTGSNVGTAGSPIPMAFDAQLLWWTGSLLTASTIDLSSSVSGCTRMVASAAGKAIVVFSATYTTSASQRVGWLASGAGGASKVIQTPMPFANNSGIDAYRLPNALWCFPSGSNAIMTTTTACWVAGNMSYTYVTS